MTTSHRDADPSLRRRRLLTGAAGLAAGASAGCLQRVQSLVSRRSPSQLSLTVASLPADVDAIAAMIAGRLANALDEAGVDTDVVTASSQQLRRDVLVNHDFDCYVARSPELHDPDALHGLLHSVHINDLGWQNPFGFTTLAVEDLLDRQRRTSGSDRRQTVAELLRSIARQQPFTVVAVPDDVGAARADRFVGWREFPQYSPRRYIGLRRASDDLDAPVTLRVAVTDGSITENLNPLLVRLGDPRAVTGLIYDPVGRRGADGVEPWLAESWSWDTADGGTTATIRLREGLTWHDGETLDASDLAFTYRFLADTSLDRTEAPIPAPAYQGRLSLVESVDRVDSDRVRLEFGAAHPEVATRAFELPVLPKHVWEETTGEASLAGFELFDDVTEALVRSNMAPIGSGPLRFESATTGEWLTLTRFTDHFLERTDPGETDAAATDAAATDAAVTGTAVTDTAATEAARTGATGETAGSPGTRGGDAALTNAGGLAFDRFEVRVAPSDASLVELAAAGEVDATATRVKPGVVPRIGRSSELQLLIERSRSFYHVGFNVRRAHLGNPHFRRVVARLLDKQAIVEEILDGYGAAASTPLAGTDWVPDGLDWEGSDPEVPYLGSDGELDTEAVREAFRAAGYEYDERGRLLDR